MTIENCKRLLEGFKAKVNDSSLSEQARLNAKAALKDMEANMARKGYKTKPEKDKA